MQILLSNSSHFNELSNQLPVTPSKRKEVELACILQKGFLVCIVLLYLLCCDRVHHLSADEASSTHARRNARNGDAATLGQLSLVTLRTRVQLLPDPIRKSVLEYTMPKRFPI